MFTGEKIVSTAERFGQFRLLLVSIIVLLFADLVCLNTAGNGLLSLNFGQLKGIFGPREIILSLLGYSVFSSVLVPIILSICGILSVSMLNKPSVKEIFDRRYMLEDDVERYASSTKNSVVYQELQSMRRRRADDTKLARAGLSILILLLIELYLAKSGSDVALVAIYHGILILGSPIAEISFIAAGLLLLWLFAIPVLSWVQGPIFLYVPNATIRSEVEEFTRVQKLNADEQASDARKSGKEEEDGVGPST